MPRTNDITDMKLVDGIYVPGKKPLIKKLSPEEKAQHREKSSFGGVCGSYASLFKLGSPSDIGKILKTPVILGIAYCTIDAMRHYELGPVQAIGYGLMDSAINFIPKAAAWGIAGRFLGGYAAGYMGYAAFTREQARNTALATKDLLPSQDTLKSIHKKAAVTGFAAMLLSGVFAYDKNGREYRKSHPELFKNEKKITAAAPENKISENDFVLRYQQA